MPDSEWPCRRDALAKELLAACATVLPGAEIRIKDDTTDMLAAEEDMNVVPSYRIGTIHSFCVQERRTRHLLGRRWMPWRHWATIVSFHIEEMWNAAHWTAEHGMECYVTDARVSSAAMPILERFARDNRLLFRAVQEKPKDP